MLKNLCQTIGIVGLLLLLGFVIESQATTYYVGKQGSAANSCTTASTEGATDPTKRKLTINQGIACMSGGGHTVVIGPGTYNELISDSGYNPGYSGTPPPAGSAGAYTTLKAETSRTATVTATRNGGGLSSLVTLEAASTHHVRVEGLVIVGQSGEGTMNGGMTTWESQAIQFVGVECSGTEQGWSGAGNTIELLQVWFHDIAGGMLGGAAPCTPGEIPYPGLCHGLYSQPGSPQNGPVILADSLLENINGYGVQNYTAGTIVRNTIVRNTYSGGIVSGPPITAYNNVFAINGQYGIQAGNGANTLINNTIYQVTGVNSPTGFQLGGGIVTNTSSTVKNNLIIGVASGGVGYISGASNSSALVSHNMCTGASPGCATVVSSSATFFVNASAGDYHTHADSPAVNAGVTLGAPYHLDPDGRNRNSTPPWDIGAYEFVSGAPSAPVALQFGAQPTGTGAGQPISPPVTVRIVDALGATVSSSTATVTLTLGVSPPVGTLGGDTSNDAVGGVATFPGLTVTPANADYTLVAQSPPLAHATSSAFTIAPAVPDHLGFVDDPPASTPAGAVITPPIRVGVRDASGNIITTATNAVTLSLQQNPAGGTLACGPPTCTKNAVAGVATFDTLSVAKAGTGYTFGATTTGLRDNTDQSGFFAISPVPSGNVHNVSTAAQLTTAMSAAVAGDEIVLANGTYSGTFTTNNAGTSGSKITLRAATPHQAVLVGDNVCDRSHEGLVLADAYWVVQDLKFTQHGRAMRITANNVEVAHNLLEGYREEGIRIDGGDTNSLHHNVIGYSKGCTGTDSPAIFVVTNADSNVIQHNIIVGTGNDGYMCGGVGGCAGGDKFGYGVFVANNSDNTLIQGNLLLGNGGKGVLRLLSDGANSASVTGTIVRDNMFFFGEGAGATSDDCNDDGNSFLNNLFYGNYFWNWYTKGNDTSGTKGHHTFSHNTAYATALTRGNVGFITALGGPANCNQAGQNYHIANILQNNLFYADSTLTGGFDDRTLLTTAGTTESTSLATKSHNLFWAPSAPATWVRQYTYTGTDIHAAGSQPLFGSVAAGDFSLQAGSPGKAAASDGTDMGITYNSFLKPAWSANVMALAGQETTGLAAATSTSFAVEVGRPYQVWFYVPTSPCAQTNEQFTVEGSITNLVRDITTLHAGTTGIWLQTGGPQRYITLGRHTSTDGTLNVSWPHAGCVERVFVRALPTAPEAYQWIVGPAPEGPADITSNLVVHYGLNAGVGTTVADDSGTGNAGTFAGTPTWIAGRLGGGLQLDAAGDYVQRTTGISLPIGATDTVTLAGWVKASAYTDYGHLFGFGSDPLANPTAGRQRSFLTINNHYYVWLSGGCCDWDTGITFDTDNAWHHIAVTMSPTTLTFYRDGVLRATIARPAGLLSTATTITLGRNYTLGTGFVGSLDDVRIYARALTATDVTALASLVEPPTPPPPTDLSITLFSTGFFAR